MTCERRTVVIDDQFCCAAQQRSTTSAPSPARRRAPGTSATAPQDWRVKETRRDCLFSSVECAPEDRLISMSEYRLAHEIIAFSRARTWAEAKLEWEILEVYEVKAPEACLCGHRPIVELCVLINKVNGQRATVGNHCVKQFLGLPSGQIFEALKRIEKDPTRSLNKEAIGHYSPKPTDSCCALTPPDVFAPLLFWVPIGSTPPAVNSPAIGCDSLAPRSNTDPKVTP